MSDNSSNNLAKWRRDQFGRVEQQEREAAAQRQQQENAPDQAERIRQDFEKQVREDSNPLRRKK
jgi:hypothetical protein